MNDLFGQPIADEAPKLTKFGKKKRDETPRGYAGTPGRGPAGHFCQDCRHIVRKVMGKTYLKCWLMQRTWTGGFKTDIRAHSPACQHWSSKVQVDLDATHLSAARTFYVKH